MKIKINWFNTLTIAIAIIALIFSYLSWDISRQNFEYEVQKDSMINTPSINEIVDSTSIKFGLSNNSELQGLQIVFPKEIEQDPIKLGNKPFTLSKFVIENIAKNYLRDKIKVKDSTVIVGIFTLPVIIDYSAVALGSPHNLRENRFLVFNFSYYDNVESIDFKNTYLFARKGYPLKGHYFFKFPFMKSIEERVAQQDSNDVQELLALQLKELKKNLEY